MDKLSDSNVRNTLYNSFLDAANSPWNTTTEDLIRLGAWVMATENLNYNHSRGNAVLDSQYLAFFSLKLPYEYDKEIYRQKKVSAPEIINFIKLLEKRVSQRLPLPYITNEAWYLGWRFYVNENALVPRSIMNHKFQEFLQDVKWSNYKVLDLCAGSGCIGISLALLDSRIRVDLVDMSSEALKIAKANIESYFVIKDRVNVIQSDLFSNVAGTYDLIITNPPYLPTEEYNLQCAEYKAEPKIALEAGKKGLDLVKRILNDSWKYMNQDGVLIAEIGWTGEDFCKKDYPDMPFEWIVTSRQNDFQSRSGVFRLKYGYQDYWKVG
jgi:ribosomal protein L3 glutamine methyltransferase